MLIGAGLGLSLRFSASTWARHPRQLSNRAEWKPRENRAAGRRPGCWRCLVSVSRSGFSVWGRPDRLGAPRGRGASGLDDRAGVPQRRGARADPARHEHQQSDGLYRAAPPWGAGRRGGARWPADRPLLRRDRTCSHLRIDRRPAVDPTRHGRPSPPLRSGSFCWWRSGALAVRSSASGLPSCCWQPSFRLVCCNGRWCRWCSCCAPERGLGVVEDVRCGVIFIRADRRFRPLLADDRGRTQRVRRASSIRLVDVHHWVSALNSSICSRFPVRRLVPARCSCR